MTTPEVALTTTAQITVTYPFELGDMLSDLLWETCRNFEAALKDYGQSPTLVRLDTNRGEQEFFTGQSECGGQEA